MKILLVEDHADIRYSLQEFLGEIGHNVLVCSNGEEALNTLKKEPVDLVLSDIQMPKLNGHELLRKMKSSDQLQSIDVMIGPVKKDDLRQHLIGNLSCLNNIFYNNSVASLQMTCQHCCPGYTASNQQYQRRSFVLSWCE